MGVHYEKAHRTDSSSHAAIDSSRLQYAGGIRSEPDRYRCIVKTVGRRGKCRAAGIAIPVAVAD